MPNPDIETLLAKLEEGEIDEKTEPEPEPSAFKETVETSSDNSVIIIGEVPKDDDKSDSDDIPLAQLAALEAEKKQLRKLLESKESNSEKMQSTNNLTREQLQELYEEDEMLCVRGASPVFYVVDEPPSYLNKSPIRDNGMVVSNDERTPSKRRKTSGKRRRKRSTPKKIHKAKSISSEEGEDTETMRRQSPVREKLPQLCKFFLQNTCVKGYNCEYMHSEFPCKYYYMGLKCEDEDSEEGCKLAHGDMLSPNMLAILIRHIHTAPNNVLGQKFVDIRSNMKAGEANKLLQDMQKKLKPEENVSETSHSDSDAMLFQMLREKLYFLSEEQLNRLQQLRINKVEDLLNLTLAQLNAIGIHAIQIEAIQMSLVAGQDTDMRTLYPTLLEPPVEEKQTIPSFEVVCYDSANACDPNWYEDEEQPLIIDETKTDDVNEVKVQHRDEDEDLIDVVGETTPPQSISEESITRELVIERVGPEDDNKEDQPNIADECNAKLENTQQSEKSETMTLTSENEEEMTNKINETTCTSENQDKVIGSSENQEELLGADIKQDTNDVSPLVADMIDKEIEMDSLDDSKKLQHIVSPCFTPPPKDDVAEEIEKTNTPSPKMDDTETIVRSKTPSPRMETPILNERSFTPIPENILGAIDLTETTPPRKSKNPSSPVKVEPKPHKYNNPFHRIIISPENDPRKKLSPLKGSRRERANFSPENEFRKKISPVRGPRKERKDFSVENDARKGSRKGRRDGSPENDFNHRFSSLKDWREPEKDQLFTRPVNQKFDDPMQGDNSSEDWDAEEQIPSEPPSKKIACIDSPDPSDDEASSAFVAPGIYPILPSRSSNLDNYKPALEINAHLTYPAMEYKLYEIYLPETEVNKPSFVDKLLKANSIDPRLKKFIEKEKNCGVFPQTDYSFFPPSMSQCDPRLRPGHGNTCTDQYYNASPILYSYLQRSSWYQELKSNLKIQINHSVSDLVRALNLFHKDPSPRKIFDLFQIECAGVLLEVMRNVGIFIDANGNITEESNYQQLCVSLQQQPMMNLRSPSSSMGQAPKPGLLGFAPPGIQHPHQNSQAMSHESIFIRQAFGNDYIGNNNGGDFSPSGNTFYVGNHGINRNQDFDNEPAPYRRQGQKRSFKRR